MWKRIVSLRFLFFICFLILYCAVIIRNLSEGTRRSLQLRDDSETTDHVAISVLVTGVNPATQELTVQIALRPQGQLAQDEVTPSVDLKLLTNNVRSQQEFEFPKGKRMNRIEAVFPLNGELNRYPLDRYRTTLWLLVTTPARTMLPASSKVPGKHRRDIAPGRSSCPRRSQLETKHHRPTHGYFVGIDTRHQI